MSIVLTVVQVTAGLLLLAPLVVVAGHALRRADRKIEKILREECGPDTPTSQTPAEAPGHVIRHAAGEPRSR
jgi:hypothetical protein